MRKTIAAWLMAGLLAAPLAFAGEIYTFTRITNNGGSPSADTQFTVEVIDSGPGQVSFVFRNIGSSASSITDVYFDDGTLLGIASVINGGSGVDFSQGASPGNLPGGNPVNFVASAGFTADSNPPAQPSGVNPGEYLTIIFNLIGGQDYDDTIAALEMSLASPGVDVTGGLRIGIHVQGFGNGQSESFVNGPPQQVPEPASIALLGVGLAALALGRRRRVV